MAKKTVHPAENLYTYEIRIGKDTYKDGVVEVWIFYGETNMSIWGRESMWKGDRYINACFLPEDHAQCIRIAIDECKERGLIGM